MLGKSRNRQLSDITLEKEPRNSNVRNRYQYIPSPENHFNTQRSTVYCKTTYSTAENQYLPIILFGIIMVTENAISTNSWIWNKTIKKSEIYKDSVPREESDCKTNDRHLCNTEVLLAFKRIFFKCSQYYPRIKLPASYRYFGSWVVLPLPVFPVTIRNELSFTAWISFFLCFWMGKVGVVPPSCDVHPFSSVTTGRGAECTIKRPVKISQFPKTEKESDNRILGLERINPWLLGEIPYIPFATECF